ncbi:MAG TPA: MraY family glycosyltransferase [bacterium]|nr:MraY family glycosyltransferase [bacterium]
MGNFSKLSLSLFNYISIGVIAFIISFALTPLARFFSLKFGFVDKPDYIRKLHDKPRPLMGGLAIYAAFISTIIFCYYSIEPFYKLMPYKNYTGLLLGSLLMLMIGIFDDMYSLTPFLKLFLQIVPAIILFYYDYKIDLLTNPITGETINLAEPVSFVLTIIWVISLTNAINLIDGMDGLAIGITIIGSATLFIIALNRGTEDIVSAILTVSILGAAAGFIKYNFPPASIFMGDAGSLVIGFIMSVIGITGINKSTTAIALMVPIAAVGLPVYDTLFAILRRTRRGNKIFSADSEHIHHRLLKVGLSHRQTLLLLYGLSVYFGVIAYAFLKIPNQMAFLLLIFFIFSIFILASYLRKKEVKIYIRQKEESIKKENDIIHKN